MHRDARITKILASVISPAIPILLMANPLKPHPSRYAIHLPDSREGNLREMRRFAFVIAVIG
jgi:hypothetical protein